MVRVCVLNVHSWHDAGGSPRLDDTIALLKTLACDLVFLNEVPDDGAVRRVAHELALELAYGPAQWAGNAILSRAKLVDPRNVPLAAVDAEERAVVMARVSFGQAFTVACTHLDHVREHARLEQLAKLRAAVGGRACLIAGDFNALRSSDYPEVRLQAVREHRADNFVEEPRDDVVNRMDAWGFVDAARLADANGDYRAALARPIAPPLRSTCWAGTRIDYVWLSASLAARVTRAQAEVVTSDVSDHRPLVVTLELGGP